MSRRTSKGIAGAEEAEGLEAIQETGGSPSDSSQMEESQGWAEPVAVLRTYVMAVCGKVLSSLRRGQLIEDQVSSDLHRAGWSQNWGGAVATSPSEAPREAVPSLRGTETRKCGPTLAYDPRLPSICQHRVSIETLHLSEEGPEGQRYPWQLLVMSQPALGCSCTVLSMDVYSKDPPRLKKFMILDLEFGVPSSFSFFFIWAAVAQDSVGSATLLRL